MTDLIYTWGTLAHTSSKNPFGLNVLWGDGHINFCKTRAAFDTKLWGGTGANPTTETPGDNAPKWRTIVSPTCGHDLKLAEDSTNAHPPRRQGGVKSALRPSGSRAGDRSTQIIAERFRTSAATIFRQGLKVSFGNLTAAAALHRRLLGVGWVEINAVEIISAIQNVDQQLVLH